MISFVGAAAALADLDGDGLPNDLVFVDPGVDRVTVAPAPGTGTRYEPFPLVRTAKASPSGSPPCLCTNAAPWNPPIDEPLRVHPPAVKLGGAGCRPAANLRGSSSL